MNSTKTGAINCRMLVANLGPEINSELICRASMVAGMYEAGGLWPPGGNETNLQAAEKPRRSAGALRRGLMRWRARGAQRPGEPSDAELRFLALLPSERARHPAAARTARLALRSQVDQYLRVPDDATAVGCDVLCGQTIGRLLSYVSDFDGAVLVVGSEGWSRRRLARLTLAAPCSVWVIPSGWAPAIRRILVPIEFNSQAAPSLRAAVALARRCPTAKCVVLHVDRQDSLCGGGEIGATRLRELSASCDEALKDVDTDGVRITRQFVKGQFVARSIVRAADENATDLIVMSTRVRTGIVGRLCSSVTGSTLCETRCAMAVLKPEGPPLSWRDAVRERLQRGDDIAFS